MESVITETPVWDEKRNKREDVARVCCPFLQWSQMVLTRVVRFLCAGMLRSAHGTAEVDASSSIVMSTLT